MFDSQFQFISVTSYSETLRQSENAVEKSPMPAGSITDKGGDIDEDDETEISEYLTLAQLGSILRELAVKGRISADNIAFLVHFCFDYKFMQFKSMHDII